MTCPEYASLALDWYEWVVRLGFDCPPAAFSVRTALSTSSWTASSARGFCEQSLSRRVLQGGPALDRHGCVDRWETLVAPGAVHH
jgi:hypothetical protein